MLRQSVSCLTAFLPPNQILGCSCPHNTGCGATFGRSVGPGCVFLTDF